MRTSLTEDQRGASEVQPATMIVVLHVRGFAREVADRTCLLHEGSILQEGPPVDILTCARRM
jgi:ABC-type polar amino acid transport system ATPase subunit